MIRLATTSPESGKAFARKPDRAKGGGCVGIAAVVPPV